ncbi:MAG: ABC transporter ATP-binding protein [Nitrososphaerota archaeon]
MKAISGLVRPSSGRIDFLGKRIEGKPPNEIAKMGIIYVSKREKTFPYMSVYENLLMGAYIRNDARGIKEDLEKVYSLFPILRERAHQQAGTLSGGERQMLCLGRAMMARPRLYLIDEPSLGLSPILVEKVFEKIWDMKKAGMTAILVEQNADASLRISDNAYVLESGTIRMKGRSEDLLKDKSIVSAYLGG